MPPKKVKSKWPKNITGCPNTTSGLSEDISGGTGSRIVSLTKITGCMKPSEAMAVEKENLTNIEL